MSDAYVTYLEERYQGEIFGEATFDAWAEACSDTVIAEKLRVLGRLERETGRKLAAALRELGRDPKPDPARLEEGRKIGQGMAGARWREVLGGFQEQIAPLVEAFEQAEALAPDEAARPLLVQVTAHERALLAFAERELAGRDDALAPVEALLDSSG